MSQKDIDLIEEDWDFIRDYVALPEEEQRFTEILVRIGATNLLTEEEYRFFVGYLRRQDAKLLEIMELLDRLPK